MSTSVSPAQLVLRRLQELNDICEVKKAPKEVDIVDQVEKVLEAAFQVGVQEYTFTPDEQHEFSSLIIDTFDDIDNAVYKIGLHFDISRGPYNLCLRSGLQFIQDGLGGLKLEKVLGKEKNSALIDSVKTFDEGIKNWKDCGVVTDEDIVHSYEDLCRPRGVPTSHTWWWYSETDTDSLMI